jgi:hypothetical protein
MKVIKKIIYIVLIAAPLSCTVMKVSDRNQYGYYSESKSAVTSKFVNVNLDSLNSLILVPNNSFTKAMVEEIGYFENALTFIEFEKLIIADNKQDEIGSISGIIGLNIASRKYRSFLYLTVEVDNNDRKKVQLKLTNPKTSEDLFIAFVSYSPGWTGVYDNNTFNPLFNELIKYIETNSKTYSRTNN